MKGKEVQEMILAELPTNWEIPKISGRDRKFYEIIHRMVISANAIQSMLSGEFNEDKKIWHDGWLYRKSKKEKMNKKISQKEF